MKRGEHKSGRAALTGTERAVMAILAGKAGKTVTREEVLSGVWPGRETDMNFSTVDRHISALRRKLAGRAVIKSVYGSGYKLILRSPS